MFVYELSDSMKQMKMYCEFTEIVIVKIESQNVHGYSFGMDNSLNILYKPFKSLACIHEI